MECKLIKGFFHDWQTYCKVEPEDKKENPRIPEIPPCASTDIFIRCWLEDWGDCICVDYRPSLWRM